MLKKLWHLDAWSKATIFILTGALFLGKASVYVMLAFGGLLILSPRALWDPWYSALTRRRDELNPIGWPLLVSLLYGIATLIHGVLEGYAVKTAFQVLLFNISPFFLFLGIWTGFRYPGTLRTYFRGMAWFITIYSPLYFLVISKTPLGRGEYAVLGPPGTGSLILLGLLGWETYLAKFWAPIIILVALTIATQERADWLGFGLALMVWGKLTKQMNRVFSVVMVLVTILVIAALMDLRMPGLPGRWGELSARGTLARMAGAVSADLAMKFEDNRGDASFYYGTVHWRKKWWAGIREEVSKDPMTMTFGLGYGYPLSKLSGNSGTMQEGTRSPHNIFYFNLAYSGLVGFAIFVWLEIGLGRILFRVYQVTGQVWGFAYWVYSMIGAFFGNYLESPLAIGFYLLIGLGIGPMLLQLELNKHPEYSELEEHSHVAEMA
jgi:O-Antigen ligase